MTAVVAVRRLGLRMRRTEWIAAVLVCAMPLGVPSGLGFGAIGIAIRALPGFGPAT